MWESSDKMTLGRGLNLLADAVFEKNDLKLSDAAIIMEAMCDRDYTSKRAEPIYRALSAFAFEASGESPRSKRSYLKLRDLEFPLEEVLGTKHATKNYAESISHYGLRDLGGFKTLAEVLFEELKKQQRDQGSPSIAFTSPDYLISLGIIDLLLAYCEALEGTKKLKPIFTKIESLDETTRTSSATPWLAILARLVCYMLGSVVKRSIINLGLNSYIESRLIKKGTTELWIPQAEAVNKGLFRGKNIVYSTGTATGKSLLAYLLAGTGSVDEKIFYIVPTRTLAQEAFRTLTDLVDLRQTPVAISTRERTEFDDKLSECAVIIATFEKFASILKQKKIDEKDIKCLVADEVHFMSKWDRGIPLELTLTEMKGKIGVDDPQIVALSAMINEEDAKDMASWLRASSVRTDWRPVDLDEMIFCKGNLHHKSGIIEKIHHPVRMLSSDAPKSRQRMAVAMRLVRDKVIRGGQCMIVVRSRRDAEKVAEGISRYLDASHFFDPDSRSQLSIRRMERQKLERDIQRSEPELPICAQRLVRLLKNGVAYHHAGLPAKYRKIVEFAVRHQLVMVLVTTTTFEVGVNLPISTIIFLDMGKGRRGLPIRTYRNLAGRAGRPKFDVKGESIIVTLTENELQRVKERYFLSEEEPLLSAIQYFMRRRPVARYAIQSKIIEMVAKHDVLDFQQLVAFMSQSWFWLKADKPTREEFIKHIKTELWKLDIFGFIEASDDGIKITNSGRIAGRVMLSPLSIRNLIDNAKKIFAGGFDEDERMTLLLSLVGIPHEVGDNDQMIQRVEASDRCKIVSDVLRQDPALLEPAERIQLCPQYATVLRRWVDGIPTHKILRLSGLDPSSDAALLEELLPNDAYWVLSTLASIPDYAVKMSRKQRDSVSKLADDCRYGSSDPTVHELLSLEMKYMGRNTAIKIADYLQEQNKSLTQLDESDFVRLFPRNPEAAKLSFSELEQSYNLTDQR